jgi:signal transduction histidine kinase
MSRETTRGADLGAAEPWLRLLGASIWTFLGVSRWVASGQDGVHTWVVPWVAYGACFLVASLHHRLPAGVPLAALTGQTVAAAFLSARGLPGFEGLLLSIVVAQVPTVLPLRTSIVWAALQLPLLVLLLRDKILREELESVGAYSTFSIFSLLLYRMHHRELLGRRALAAAHAEIVAMRSLLVERTREGERLRISRELHDSLGHQLTALRIQLELATKLAEGASAEPLQRAQAVSQVALDGLRGAVGELRRSETIDVAAAFRRLATTVPVPSIHVAAGATALTKIHDRVLAHALIRCAEEAVTNAVKHADARHVWIEATVDAARAVLSVRDDGRGRSRVVEGHGLTGMRERVTELGGELEVRTSAGRGFEVRVRLPRRKDETEDVA